MQYTITLHPYNTQTRGTLKEVYVTFWKFTNLVEDLCMKIKHLYVALLFIVN